MMQSFLSRPYLWFVLLFLSCGSSHQEEGQAEPVFYPVANFGDHWYQGQAEISSYTLEQARYGEIKPGTAVLVFVTEPFSKGKQVKLDDPSRNPDDAVSVLKLNYVKKFTTGVYPYSMMTSVFTPVQIDRHPSALKSTTSSQEWCGHTFTQLNLKGKKYAVESRSYFESEGDQDFELEDVWLEDELLTRIRINPESLPVGEIKVIPGGMVQRLTHQELKVNTAIATLGAKPNEEGMKEYSLQYPDRSLVIFFAEAFPFEIAGWEETYKSGFGPNAQELTTKATLKKRMMLDYWSRHDNKDLYLREELGLD